MGKRDNKKKRGFQTADEWLKQKNAQESGSDGNSGGYQTADEWLKRNASRLAAQKMNYDETRKKLYEQIGTPGSSQGTNTDAGSSVADYDAMRDSLYRDIGVKTPKRYTQKSYRAADFEAARGRAALWERQFRSVLEDMAQNGATEESRKRFDYLQSTYLDIAQSLSWNDIKPFSQLGESMTKVRQFLDHNDHASRQTDSMSGGDVRRQGIAVDLARERTGGLTDYRQTPVLHGGSGAQRQRPSAAQLQQEIDALQKQIDEIEYDWTDHAQRVAAEKKVADLQRQIDEKKVYLAQAQRIQEKADFSAVADPESEKYDPDFASKSGYVSTELDSRWKRAVSQYSMGYDDLTYEYINNQNDIRNEIKRKARAYSTDETPFEKNGYDYMTEDEVSLYNYYYSMGGKDSAEAYLAAIQEDLNQRKAAGMYQQMEGKTGAELVFGVEAGLDQFKGGIKGAARAIMGDGAYVAPSAIQYASGMVREDLADDGSKLPSWLGGASLGQVGYDAITTTANMAPSAAVGVLNPALGTATLGVSAGGNAYQEALNEGYSVDQARGYGILSGASEVVMEKLLGGISAYGGNTLGKFFTRNMKNADNALKRIAKELGGSMLSEFSEEYLQEVLTPVFRNLTLGTDEEVTLVSEEALYAGFLGAITGGVVEGPQAVSSARNAALAPSNTTPAPRNATEHTDNTTLSLDNVTEHTEKPTPSADEVQIRTENLESDGFHVEQNSERGTTEVTFAEKPAAAVQAALKENGFKWSKKSGVWYGEGSPEQARQIVREALGLENGGDSVRGEAVADADPDAGSNAEEKDSVQEAPNMAAEETEDDHAVSVDLSFGENSPSGKKKSYAAEADRPFEISIQPGKTLLNLEDGSMVETQITGIASSEKGNLMLNVIDADGREKPARADSISYANGGEAALYHAINSMDLKPAAAQEFVNMARRSGDTTGEFAFGVQQMYTLGEMGVSHDKAVSSGYGGKLDDVAKDFGYYLGKRVFDAKNGPPKVPAAPSGNAKDRDKTAGKETGAKKSAKGSGSSIAAGTDVDVLRQAVENVSSLALSEKEKNALTIFSEKLEKLDAMQKQEQAIREKTAPLTAQEQARLKNIEAQEMRIGQKLNEFANYPLLKSVSAKTREALQKKYGTLPAGENPARAADIPGQTNAGNRVSKTAGTAIEAAVTTDQAAQVIREKTVEGDFSYLPITDEGAKQRAEETIKRKGWNDALTDWRVGMSKTRFPGKDMVTMGFQLYNNAVNAGDSRAAVQILTDITNTVRNSAQIVQAVRILKQLSPDNRLYAIQRQLDSLQEELNNRYGEKAPQIDMNSALAENYKNAQGAENIRAAEEALFRDIAAKLPNTFADKWNAWRYLSMLGNARTHVRNVLGNIGFVPVRATKDLIASGIEAGVNALSKDGIARTKGILLAVSKDDRARYQVGLSDFAAAEDLIGSPNVKSGDSISRLEQLRPAFGGDKAIWRALSKVAEINSGALSLEDTLFKKHTYAAAFGGYLKANGITAQMLQNGEVTDSFVDAARTYAFQEALKATYNDFNAFSNFVAKIGNLRNSENSVAKVAGFLVEGVLPFKRTPANIVARAVEYSPIGMVNGIKKSISDVRKGRVTAAEAIDSLASGLTGTVLLGLGSLLAGMGIVTGGDDDDDKQKKFDQLRGKQSYALNAFGGSYTIDWLAPEVIPMFIGVELYNRVNSDGSLQLKDLLDSFTRVSNPLLEMSCMSSLNDLLDSISYSDNKLYSVFSQAAANHVLQALPTVFGQLERIGETEREQTYIDNGSPLPKDLQYTIAKAANKIPGVEFEQIPYIDAYGRRQASGSVGTRIFSNGFSPGYLGSDRSAPWDNELQRLYDLGYSSVLPSTAAKKIGDRELTAEEYVQYATFTGQEKYRLLGEVTQSGYYQQSSDADKDEIIRGVYAYVNAMGAKQIVPDQGVAAWTEKASDMEKLGIPFADFLRMKNEALNENGNVTKAVYVEYIQEHFPVEKQADVWQIMKNPKWKDEGTPWG